MLGLLHMFNNLRPVGCSTEFSTIAFFHHTWTCHNQCLHILHSNKFHTHTTCFLNKQILFLVQNKMYFQLHQHLHPCIPHPSSGIISLQYCHICLKMSTKDNKKKIMMMTIQFKPLK